MAKKWKDVLSSGDYQSLSIQDKRKSQLMYFDEVVLPQVPEGRGDEAKQGFFADYPLPTGGETPEAQPEREPTLAEEFQYAGGRVGKALTFPVTLATEALGGALGVKDPMTPGKAFETLGELGRPKAKGQEKFLGDVEEFMVAGAPMMKAAQKGGQMIRAGQTPSFLRSAISQPYAKTPGTASALEGGMSAGAALAVPTAQRVLPTDSPALGATRDIVAGLAGGLTVAGAKSIGTGMASKTAKGVAASVLAGEEIDEVGVAVSQYLDPDRLFPATTQEGRKVVVDMLRNKRDALTNKVTDVIDYLGVSDPSKRSQYSRELLTQLEDKSMRVTDIADRMYAKVGNPDIDTTALTKRLSAAQEAIPKTRAQELRAPYAKQVGEDLRPQIKSTGIVSESGEAALQTVPTKLRDLTEARSSLGELIKQEEARFYSAPADASKKRLGELSVARRAINDALENAEKLGVEDPNVIRDLDEANAFFRNAMSEEGLGLRAPDVKRILGGRIPDDEVASFVLSDKKRLETYLRPFSDNPTETKAVMAELEKFAAAELLDRADDSGVISQKAIEQWRKRYGEILPEHFGELDKQTQKAIGITKRLGRYGVEKTPDPLTKDYVNARNRAFKFWYNTDPDSAVKEIMGASNKRMAARNAMRIANAAGSDKEAAQAALKGSFWEHMFTQFEPYVMGQKPGAARAMQRQLRKFDDVASVIFKDDPDVWARWKEAGDLISGVEMGSAKGKDVAHSAFGMLYWGGNRWEKALFMEKAGAVLSNAWGKLSNRDAGKVLSEALADPVMKRQLMSKAYFRNQARLVKVKDALLKSLLRQDFINPEDRTAIEKELK